MNRHPWHIIGAGAIGSLWAAELHAAGREPTLILKDESRLRQYRRAKGITICRGSERHVHAVAATCPERLVTPVRRLLVTTKAHQTLPALRGLGNRLAKDAVVVLMQNGLGVLDELRQHFDGLVVYQASTTEGAYRRSPVEIVHGGRGTTVIGSPDGVLNETLRQCADELSTPLLPMDVTDQIDRILWRKLAVNCAINPLTALYRCRNGALLELPDALAMIRRIAGEIVAVSRASGREQWVADLESTVHEVARATADNRSSMLQDIDAGRPTEIDYINGYLCRLAEALQIEVPANRKMLERIHELEARIPLP